ncbi:MAG: hypothetical protein ACK2U1_10290 [Anaerolineales bacterium]
MTPLNLLCAPPPAQVRPWRGERLQSFARNPVPHHCFAPLRARLQASRLLARERSRCNATNAA